MQGATLWLQVGPGGEVAVERDDQDHNEGQGRRGEEKIHGVTPKGAGSARRSCAELFVACLSLSNGSAKVQWIA